MNIARFRMARRVRVPAMALGLVIATGCAVAPSETETSAEPSAMSDPGVAAVQRLVEEIAAVHPDPWYGIARHEFETAAGDLGERMAQLGPEERVTEVMGLVALIGRDGRNGHMLALPAASPMADRLPISFYLFADGLFVIDTEPGHEALVGAEVLRIGGTETAGALEILRPLVNLDNRHTPEWTLPLLLAHPAVLTGVGLGDDPGTATLGLRLATGEAREVRVEAVRSGRFASLLEAFVSLRPPENDEVLWLSNPDTEFWLADLPQDDALYVQLNTIWEPTSAYVTQLRAAIAAADPARIVLDLRLNPGGENPNYPPLLAALADLEDEGRQLVVIVGRATFSAATAFATELAQRTDAVFVGEPSAGSPTTHANVDAFEVDIAGGMVVFLPQRTSSVGPPDAETIEPDVPVSLASGTYFEGQDPALDAALTVPPR